MTMRRADLVVTGTALALIAALIGAPIWDFWHYRALRVSPGSRYPVGLILPRHQPSIAGFTAPATRTVMPSARPWQEATNSPAPPTTTSPSRVPASPGLPATIPGPGEGRAMPARDLTAAGAAPIARHPDAASTVGNLHKTISAPGARPRSQSSSDTTGESGVSQTAVVAWGSRSAGSQEEAPPTPPTPASANVPSAAKSSGSGVAPRGAGEPEPQGPSIVSLRAEPEEPQLGDALTVSLVIEGAHGVTSLPFHLMFQPDILEFTSSEIGPAVPGSLQPILLASVNPNRPGDLAVGLSFVESSGSYTGGGVVLILHFRSVGSGITALEFDRASLRGPTSQPLETRFQNLTLTVL